MREIKFRAWQKNGTKMIDLQKITPLILNKDQYGVFLPFHKDIHLMQYTGLKDKNGVEIYEGDILRPIIINGIIADGEVIFKDGCFEVQQITNNGLPLYDCLGTRTNFEIIGNIYENPELVEK